jgi:hypothetical protein
VRGGGERSVVSGGGRVERRSGIAGVWGRGTGKPV